MLVLILTSCSTPYYNLFYNAENKFEKGEERYRSMRLQAQETRQYKIPDLEIAKLKCQALLEDFGATEEETIYADDAFYLSIKATYYLGDFYTSLELIEKAFIAVPNSEFLNDIKLFKALNYFELGDLLQAEENLSIVAASNLVGYNRVDYYTTYSKIAKSKEQELDERNFLKLAITASIEIPDDDINRLKQRAFLISEYFTLLWKFESYQEIVNNYSILFDANDQGVVLDYYPMAVFAYSKLHASEDSLKNFLATNEEAFSLINTDLVAFTAQYLTRNQKDSAQFFSDAESLNESFSDSKIRGLFIYNMAYYFDYNLNQLDTAALLYKEASQKLRIGWLKSDVLNRKLFLDGLKRHVEAQRLFETATDTIDVLSESQILQQNQLIYEKAVFLYQQKKYDDAMEQFYSLSKDTTSNDLRLSAHFYLASIYEETDRESDANKIYNRLLKEELSEETRQLLMEKLGLGTNAAKLKDSPFITKLKLMLADSTTTSFTMQREIEQSSVDSLSRDHKMAKFFLFAKRVKQLTTRDTVLFDEILQYLKTENDPQVKAYFAKYDFNYRKVTYNEDDEDGDGKPFKKGRKEISLNETKEIVTSPLKPRVSIELLSQIPEEFYYPVKFDITIKVLISSDGKVVSHSYLDEDASPSLDLKEKIETFVKKLKFNKALRKVSEAYSLTIRFSPSSENVIDEFNGEIKLEK
jgi:TolA-binding protein